MDPLRQGCPIAKTETRRVWKRKMANAGAVHQCRTLMYAGKDDYFGKVEILDIYEQPLGEMDEGSARNEGGYTLPQYRHIWEVICKQPWNPREEVYVVVMRCTEVHVSSEDLVKYRSMYREHMQTIRRAVA
jgi:hypothetical protein